MDNLIKKNKIVLSCFFFLKKIAKGLDRTVLTGSCGPIPVLTVHGINKKSGSLGLKNRFSSRFSRSDLLVRSGSENHALSLNLKSLIAVVMVGVVEDDSKYHKQWTVRGEREREREREMYEESEDARKI